MFVIMPVTHKLDQILTGKQNESVGCCSKHSKTTSVNSVQNVYLCAGKKPTCISSLDSEVSPMFPLIQVQFLFDLV